MISLVGTEKSNQPPQQHKFIFEPGIGWGSGCGYHRRPGEHLLEAVAAEQGDAAQARVRQREAPQRRAAVQHHLLQPLRAAHGRLQCQMPPKL